jgi:Flp pilus assembly pilin Flp
MRRLSTSQAGAGLLEYALLVAVLTLGLAGVLTVYRNSVGTITNKTAVTVSKQTGKGYRRPTGVRSSPVGARPAAGDPEPSEPASEPDSLSAAVRR